MSAAATHLPVDRTFAALGDATRLEIVGRLSQGSASVSELAEPFAMSLRAVMKHIAVLEEAGVVRTVKQGRVRRCELRSEPVDEATAFMQQLRTRWERRLDRLDDYVRKANDS